MKKLCLKLAMMVLTLTVITGCKENASSKTSKVDKNAEVTIYLTRHGKTMLNTTDRSQGWIDAPLTPAGIEIAESLGKGLKAEKSHLMPFIQVTVVVLLRQPTSSLKTMVRRTC